MFAALAMAGLSAAGSLMQGIGAKQASAKQARLQAIADATARNENQKVLDEVNRHKQIYGDALIQMTTPWKAVEEAERAGFNPVTWLSAGYGARVGALSDSYRMMVPEYQLQSASQVPQQHSALSAFGGALSAGASAFGTQYRADQSYDLQLGRLAAAAGGGLSLGAGNTGGALFGSASAGLARSGSSASGGASTTQTGGLGIAYPSNWMAPTPAKWEVEQSTLTNPYYQLGIDKTFGDAEPASNRYGDVMEEVFGIRNFIADTYLNVTGRGLGKDSQTVLDYTGIPSIYRFTMGVSPKPATGSVEPYLPFPGAGAGLTYAR